MNRLTLGTIILIAVIGISSFFLMSDSQNPQQNTDTTQSPTPSESSETSEMVTSPEDDAQAQAMEAVSQDIATQLGTEVEMVDITSVEAREWPDACLGQPSEDEVCAQVITPGFEITADADGQSFTYRTNSDGTIIREVS